MPTASAGFWRRFTLPQGIGISFALMAFTTFVYDTLDVCTRLGRFILQELTGWHNWLGRLFGNGADGRRADLFPARRRMSPASRAAADQPVPVWQHLLELVRGQQPASGGADAAGRHGLAVADATKRWWVWLVTGLPTVWMYVMSTWALCR